MELNYSTEKCVQIMIALLKAHNIRKVIASPGSTNVCLVASLQSDPFFEMYSSVDERSAAYLACGLACESGEPVVLTCTEATASRNYYPGLTEAFYRKLPILAITATNTKTLIGQNHPQMIDRSVVARDVSKKNLHVPFIQRDKDVKPWTNLINDAILELFRHGGGPVHIEYETEYLLDYNVTQLPTVNVVNRYIIEDCLPELPQGKTAIIIGAHKHWNEELTNAVDRFCEKNNAVVLADHISNYHGKYGVNPTIVTSQAHYFFDCAEIDHVIYIGNVSSAYRKNYRIHNVWRVNPDGEIRNVFKNTTAVFEMSEFAFFNHYGQNANKFDCSDYYIQWKTEVARLCEKVPELPFSNLWVAQQMGKCLPENSALFLGIENTLRSWNFFNIPDSVDSFANTGGFGIDGGVSSLIGASFANSNKLYFGVTGDLAFFYDMNVLGNRHIGKNVRLCIINNGIGQQFRNPGYAIDAIGVAVNSYIAAEGHYGCKSKTLIKHYAEDLGFEYFAASSKEEFLERVKYFVSPEIGEKSIVFEIFTESIQESEALKMMQTLKVNTHYMVKGSLKKILGKNGVKVLKRVLRKRGK